MIHELKCWPESFQALLDGTKTHEVRRNDRPYAVEDVLRLREWRKDDDAPACFPTGTYTGREMTMLVTYVTAAGTWGLPPDLCVLSVRECRHQRMVPGALGDRICIVCGMNVPPLTKEKP